METTFVLLVGLWYNTGIWEDGHRLLPVTTLAGGISMYDVIPGGLIAC
ncbi:MAG TPA: hypothetical protein H9671_05185 [Firmicutes bacterium]|nr:hypothetical protein [Bacillota bacterium]